MESKTIEDSLIINTIGKKTELVTTGISSIKVLFLEIQC